MDRDGYYSVSLICVGIGAILLVTYIIPTARRLQGTFFFETEQLWEGRVAGSKEEKERDASARLTLVPFLVLVWFAQPSLLRLGRFLYRTSYSISAPLALLT